MNRNLLPFKRRGVVFVLTALAAVLSLGVTLSLLIFDRASDSGRVSGEPPEAGKLFLQLRTSHHQAAVQMADAAVLEGIDRPEFRQPAQAVSASQREEICHTQNVLRSMGAEPPVEPEPGHGSHPAPEVLLDRQEIAAGIAHGATQGAAVFLVGLVAFVSLVWLPTVRVVGAGGESTTLFVRCTWVLFGLLVVSGVAELSLYAVRASGEPFGLGLLREAAFETRVGHVWLERVCLGLLTAAAVTWAARRSWQTFRWWVAAGVGGVLLATLTQLSHAAAEEGLLPLLADWLHVTAAAAWMGGLLGFPLVLFGPLRTMPAEQRARLRVRAVRRFSRIAILAVTVIVLTGVYAALLHLPDLSALIGTPYGRALLIKIGMLVLVLAAGCMNLMLEGREPFGRLVWFELLVALGIFVATGFLTSLPPPSNT